MRKHAIVGIVIGLALVIGAHASYFTLVPDTKDDKECITFDVRYPYWTHGIYIATYPHHSRSTEGWDAPYYGGVVSDDHSGAGQLIQFSSWQMSGKGAPASGIDFVYAGPHMSWARSTWEGSSGGIKGHWPNDQFKPGQWYRFVHRVWTPATPTPHLGYAGVWMKSLETGEWFHLATFKFPAQLTGFNNLGGFIERFAGNRSADNAAVEFRNSYARCNGRWKSEPNFSAHVGDIRLTSEDDGRVVRLDDVMTAADWAAHEKRKQDKTAAPPSKEAPLTFTLKQPGTPDFLDAARIDSPSAEGTGKQLVVRWSVDSKSAPQLGYEIEVYDGDTRVASVTENDPEARQCSLTLSAKPVGELNIRLRLRDIFGNLSPTAQFVASRSEPLAPVAITGLKPGLSYRYFESESPDTWSALPDFAKLTPKLLGIVNLPDITPRQRRTGYAFEFDGYLSVPANGLYTFNLVTACGARLLIGGKPVIDADGYRSIARYPGTISLSQGIYPVQIGYYQGKAQRMQPDDFLQLTWAGPGFATTPVPASAFTHKTAGPEIGLTVQARLADGIRLELSTRVTGSTGKPKRVEYYASDEQFDYFSQQGASVADYFLGATDKPDGLLQVPIWGGPSKVIRARLICDDGRTVDSPPIVITDSAPARPVDENGMRRTSLEHHLYPMNSGAKNGTVTIVGESLGLLTRPCHGDVTLIAHLAAITPETLPDGTQLPSAGNWYSGIILRNNLAARPGMPLGGATIPFIALMGAADGSTRHCDSTMINGAGNQPSGDVGSDAKWFKLTRRGSDLAAYISKDGKDWNQVTKINLPKMTEDIEAGFVHYALPSATPCLHWAEFDHLAISQP